MSARDDVMWQRLVSTAAPATARNAGVKLHRHTNKNGKCSSDGAWQNCDLCAENRFIRAAGVQCETETFLRLAVGVSRNVCDVQPGTQGLERAPVLCYHGRLTHSFGPLVYRCFSALAAFIPKQHAHVGAHFTLRLLALPPERRLPFQFYIEQKLSVDAMTLQYVPLVFMSNLRRPNYRSLNR